MTGQHIITATRSHAKERLGRLADRLRRHDDDPGGPDMDLQDYGDGMDITQALETVPEAGTLETLPPWDFAAPAAHMPPGNGYHGQTLLDVTSHGPRRYVPQPDPGPQADLGRCTIWRAAVRDHFVRQERAHGRITAGPPWFVEYARIYRKRTGLVSVREPDFALHRWDHVVDEIVAQAREAVDAERAAAQSAAEAHVTCQEYSGRHGKRAA